ncbi:MAG TPA: LAGLIDADG family homing endonuclease [Candidatus Nanoarchaeia archaeon]|nr:LAGLIDADG family homing endonuclease [Candidatus Nanoarchaeia archaeon]
MYKKEHLDLVEFLPKTIFSGENNNPNKLNFSSDNLYISLSYTTETGNNSKTEYSYTIPRFIEKNKETFEVLGLLQAEMGKTHNGCLNFSNSEPRIINKVIKWFENGFETTKENWKWFIKVNVNNAINNYVKEQIESKCIRYWLDTCKLDIKNAHPKVVSYIRNTDKTGLKEDFYGTLIIEYKNNLFSQIIKNFVRQNTYFYIIDENTENIQAFMRGIIAGECCVQNDPKTGHYSVHISAIQEKERQIYKTLLQILGINVKIYKDYKDLLISKRENLIQLLKQRLMTLHPRKYAKFLNMMKHYPGIEEETGYFTGRRKPWNTLPKEKTDKIIELYNSGTTKTKEIAELLGISIIKVSRVLKANNLGKRLVKTSESNRKKMADFTKNNPKMNIKQIAERFKVSKSVVLRAYHKYYGFRGKTANCKIPEYKIKRIIEMYKENPKIKTKEIMKELGISSSTITNVRKKYNLTNLGYKSIIGNNNKTYKKSLISALK